MVFWRYTCTAPCLGTEAVPGRNGHVTSFMAKYDSTRSGFHGYPLLGGTKTAMRTFFNFTNSDDGFLEEKNALERVRKVEVDISAPPWGAVSMVKLSTSAFENSEENFHYVGFIKWRHSGFLALNPPSLFPELNWHVRAFHGYVDKSGFINGIGVYWAPDNGCEQVLEFHSPKPSMTTTTSSVDERIFDEANTTVLTMIETSSTLPSTTTVATEKQKASEAAKIPNELADLVNEAAVSISADGCLLEFQGDYEFQRCQLNGISINTRENGYAKDMRDFKFAPETKCRVIKCRAEFGGPWTRNMHCKCDTFGCRWISMKFQKDKSAIKP
ncbi:unnamed protein product, partial [Oikopleura dioica]